MDVILKLGLGWLYVAGIYFLFAQGLAFCRKSGAGFEAGGIGRLV